MDDYKTISRPGWSSQEFGYRNYAAQSESGDLYIFPALRVLGEKIPRKRFPGYVAAFSKEQIEVYAQQLTQFSDDHHEKVSSEFNLLVHDLRRLSTAIYHSSQEAHDLIAPLEYLNSNLREARIRIENVLGAQSILKVRTDVLDYSGNPGLFDEDQNVPLYRRSDKVIKSFTAFAAKKNIRMHKQGASFGEARGPNAFEIIPYVLLDNAIKYSPYNNDITIKFKEDAGIFEISVASVGPKIADDEREEIFQKGFRGRFARTSGSPGTGVGLYLARKLVERFRGSISVATSGSYAIDQQQMSDITFRVTIPLVKYMA
ncbi:sensor histidine kinase [Rhizobium leguminosarum]|uniref:histidine kinase n=1 Tax=Rhizobium leguminosarum TaxID=384 RepID=A0A7W9ZSC8_RHILE|nr:HAMP domain-containing sensor histidine kinase [Rhizobium leguminosarum]MBB6221928.1 signal transduction histidine kinase [Rhizobium leguminosarum]